MLHITQSKQPVSVADVKKNPHVVDVKKCVFKFNFQKNMRHIYIKTAQNRNQYMQGLNKNE